MKVPWRAAANTPWRALRARLLPEEALRLCEQWRRRVRDWEHLHRARAGPGTPGREAVAGELRVERRRRQDAARRPAGHDRARLLREAAGMLHDELADRDPVRRLVAAGSVHGAGEGEEPGAGRAEPTPPGAAALEDRRHVRKRLDVL